MIKDNPKDQDIFKAEVVSLIRRVRSNDGVRFQCVICEKTLKMKAHVSSHIEAHLTRPHLSRPPITRPPSTRPHLTRPH